MSDRLPPEVAALLEQRSAARAARDWAAADALRDRLGELGWEPIDGPRGSRARPRLPAAPADEQASLLDEPATLAATAVVIADDHPEDLARFLAGMAAHRPVLDWELLVVANAPSYDLDAVLTDPSEAGATLRSSERLGWADAANLGLRRSRGAVVTLLDTSLEPTGDWLAPLLAAFGDPTVGIAGPWGVTSADGRQFDEAPQGEVDAVEAYCLAIRREALRAVGGFDHRFRFYRNADLDLSFAIRAAGWRAVRTEPLALTRHEHRGYASVPDDERDRLSRRNFYRFLKHWGDRRDLLLHPAPRHH
ncbi:MAG TPA: glycosyltransferase [Candidatus Dormibacteraeota bacterium]|nr:glycosyltransferase [Candidatus Dormibacteraeota bacterium]